MYNACSEQGRPSKGKGLISTVDLLFRAVLTSTKIWHENAQDRTSAGVDSRRSTVLRIPLRLGFLGVCVLFVTCV
jgi:hypothetical protein